MASQNEWDIVSAVPPAKKKVEDEWEIVDAPAPTPVSNDPLASVVDVNVPDASDELTRRLSYQQTPERVQEMVEGSQVAGSTLGPRPEGNWGERVWDALSTPGIPQEYAAGDPFGLGRAASGALSVMNAGMEAIRDTPLEGLATAFPLGLAESGVMMPGSMRRMPRALDDIADIADEAPVAEPAPRLTPEQESEWMYIQRTGTAEDLINWLSENQGQAAAPDQVQKVHAFTEARDQGIGVKPEVIYSDTPTGPLAEEAAAFRGAREPTVEDVFPTPEQAAAREAQMTARLEDEAAAFQAGKAEPEADPWAIVPEEQAAAAKAIEDTRVAIAEQTAKWKNAPEFDVVNKADDIDDPDIRAQFGTDGIAAVTPDGRVVFNLENIDSPETLRAAVFHEMLGHHGLSQKFGDTLDKTLDTIYDKAPQFKAMVDEWMTQNPDAYADDINPRARAAEEVFAEWSQTGEIPLTILNKIKNDIKAMLRKAGVKMDISDRELQTILAMAHDATINGKRGDVLGNGARFARVWHGSGADFDEFSHEMMGTGEGAQVFGWGTYLTESRGIGEGYRRAIGGETPAWRGVEGSWVNTRRAMDSALQEKFPNDDGISSIVAKDVTDFVANNGRKPELEEIVQILIDEGGDPRYNELTPAQQKQMFDEIADTIKPYVAYVNENFELKTKGKLYEVEIPDEATWLKWDEPLEGQPELKKILEDAGIKVEDADDYAYVEREYRQAENEFNTADHRLRMAEDILENDRQYPGVEKPEEIARMVAEADKQYAIMQKLAPKVARLREEFNGIISEAHSGEAVYERLVKETGSPKAASELLNEKGISGNKYPAGSLSGRNRGDYNYVVFNDKTPKITSKFMRKGQMGESEGPLQGRKATPEGEEGPTVGPAGGYRSNRNIESIMEEAAPTKTKESWAEWIDEAGKIKMTPKLAAKIAQGGADAPELLAADKYSVELANTIHDLSRKVAMGAASERDLYMLGERQKQLANLTQSVNDAVADAARILNSRKITVGSDKALMDSIRRMAIKYDMSTPEGAKAAAKQLVRDQKNSKRLEKVLNVFGNLLSIPRGIVSSVDLSAPFNQGLFLVTSPQFYKGIPHMVRQAFSEQAFQQTMKNIHNHPNYGAMERSGLALTELDGALVQKEEQFVNRWLEKVPGYGRLYRGSERGYSGFLNKLRADTFNKLIEQAKKAGIDYLDPANSAELKQLANYVNNATGRGDLGKFNQASPYLSSVFFSPRLMASRVALLNPHYYYKLPPVVRREAIKSAIGFGGLAATALGLASMAGMDVETDPRSSDFGTAGKGKVKYSALGNFSGYITLAARLWDGTTKNSEGKIKELGKGFGSKTRLDMVEQFLENKASPVAGYVRDWAEGKNPAGEKFDPTDISRFAPMFLSDLKKVMEEEGVVKGAAMSVPAVFGVNTKVKQPFNDIDEPDRPVPAPESFQMDGEVIDLTEEQQAQWQKSQDEYQKAITAEVIATEEWRDATKDEKVQIIKDIRKEARKAAKDDFLSTYGGEEPTNEQGSENDEWSIVSAGGV